MSKENVVGGVISGDELYTIRQIKVRLGLTDSAMRSLRGAGLPIIRFGKRGYASGRQVIEFFEGLLSDGNESQGHPTFGPEEPCSSVD